MSEKITLKGQAWIYDNKKLIQDITIIDNGHSYNDTDVLVEDIWLDLMSQGKWKQSEQSSKYFYWEYEQTDQNSPLDNGVVKIKLECPRPKPGLIESQFLDENGFPLSPRDWDIKILDSDWAKYWANQFKEMDINYNNTYSVQKKDTSYEMPYNYNNYKTGLPMEKETVTSSNTDFGNNPGSNVGDNLITDLLNLF